MLIIVAEKLNKYELQNYIGSQTFGEDVFFATRLFLLFDYPLWKCRHYEISFLFSTEIIRKGCKCQKLMNSRSFKLMINVWYQPKYYNWFMTIIIINKNIVYGRVNVCHRQLCICLLFTYGIHFKRFRNIAPNTVRTTSLQDIA